MEEDGGGDEEEQEIVEAEGGFVPIGVGTGDELGDDILEDDDEPEEAVGAGEQVGAGGLTMAQDLERKRGQDENDRWGDEIPECAFPGRFAEPRLVVKIDIG